MPTDLQDRKMLLVCPLSPMDLGNGRHLLRLWADLEDKFNDRISVAVCVRFDLNIEQHIGSELLAYLSQKFKVYTHVSKRTNTGWPAGCNGLELDAYEWFVEMNREKLFDFTYMLFAEADTLPTRKGWAEEIMNEAYDRNALQLGCMMMVPDSGCDHINGNCVLHRDMWKKCRRIFHCNPRIGWDANIRFFSLTQGHPSRLIWQDYRLGMAENPWRGDEYIFSDKFYKSPKTPFYGEALRPAMIHGIKSLDGIKAVRRKILGEIIS